MKNTAYVSPELIVRWFEQEDIVSDSIIVDDPNTDSIGDNTENGFFENE